VHILAAFEDHSAIWAISNDVEPYMPNIIALAGAPHWTQSQGKCRHERIAALHDE